jgi:hypothetical protein|nr:MULTISPECIES: hypothetical protein [Mycolicibacterium]
MKPGPATSSDATGLASVMSSISPGDLPRVAAQPSCHVQRAVGLSVGVIACTHDRIYVGRTGNFSERRRQQLGSDA